MTDLSFDGKGINGPDEYRSRLATFTNDDAADTFGPLFAAAPNLLAALEAIVFQTPQGPVLERDACISQARAAITSPMPPCDMNSAMNTAANPTIRYVG